MSADKFPEYWSYWNEYYDNVSYEEAKSYSDALIKAGWNLNNDFEEGYENTSAYLTKDNYIVSLMYGFEPYSELSFTMTNSENLIY